MVTTHITTAAELLAMGSDFPCELILGELIEVSPSAYSTNLVLSYIHWELYGFVRTHRLGSVSVAEAGFLVETDPDTVIAPDIAFIVRDRMPNQISKRGYLPICPDLIIEVISPTDERRDIERKQKLYARIEVPLVWWIDPRRETASIQVPGQQMNVLARNGRLDGGSVLPGFSLELAAVFAES